MERKRKEINLFFTNYIMIEREITYLAKELPSGLKDCPFKEIIDVYIP